MVTGDSQEEVMIFRYRQTDHETTFKNHGNQPKTMKNHETTFKNHGNQPKTMKNQEVMIFRTDRQTLIIIYISSSPSSPKPTSPTEHHRPYRPIV